MAVGIPFVIIVGVGLGRGWYFHRIVTHLESLGATVTPKSGGAFVGVSEAVNVAKFLKEAEGDFRIFEWVYLILCGTDVSDKDLLTLATMRGLSGVELRHSLVTEEGARKLRQALPHCSIYWEPPAKDERQSPAAPDQLR